MQENEYAQYPMVNDGPGAFPEAGPSINLGDYLKIAKQRKWSFLMPLVVVVAIAAAVALKLPAKYRSSATILIESQELPPEFVMATVTSFAEQRLQQINQRITSTSKLLEIIDKYNLYKKMRAKQTTEEVVDQMREDIKLKQISADIKDPRTGRATSATIAFTLSYEGMDPPATIQRVANVLVSEFLQENIGLRERQTAEASEFLDDEMQKVQAELDRVAKNLAQFKEQHINELPELLSVNIQGVHNTERDIERLEEQMRSLKEQEGYLQTQLASLSPFAENSDRNRLRQLETDLVGFKTRLSEDHPDVIKARAEIKALKDKMARDAKNKKVNPDAPDNPAYVTLSSQLASTQSEIQSVTLQMADARRTLKKFQGRIEKTPAVEREYKEISMKQGNLQEKFNDLMAKHMEAKVAHGLEKEQKGERFTLIDAPRVPEKPFKPNRKAILIIGVVLGLGAGVGMGVLREFMDPSVRSDDKLAMVTGLPVLGRVPALVTHKERRRNLIIRLATFGATFLIIVVGVALFHYYVMDLNVFWAKIGRKLSRM
jgi:protein tyrosine kinase modulator